jgi:hypothetical protein
VAPRQLKRGLQLGEAALAHARMGTEAVFVCLKNAPHAAETGKQRARKVDGGCTDRAGAQKNGQQLCVRQRL